MMAYAMAYNGVNVSHFPYTNTSQTRYLGIKAHVFWKIFIYYRNKWCLTHAVIRQLPSLNQAVQTRL